MLTLKDCLNDNILDDDFVSDIQNVMRKVEVHLKKKKISYEDMSKLLDMRLTKGNKLFNLHKKTLEKYFLPSFVNGVLQSICVPQESLKDYAKGKYLGVVVLLILGSKEISPEQNLIISPNLWRNINNSNYSSFNQPLFPIEEPKGFYVQTKHNPFKERTEDFMNYGSIPYIMSSYREKTIGVIKDFYIYRDLFGNIFVASFPNFHGLLNSNMGAVDIPKEDLQTFETLEKAILRTENNIINLLEEDIKDFGEWDNSENEIDFDLEKKFSSFINKIKYRVDLNKLLIEKPTKTKYEITKLISLEVIKALAVSLHLKSNNKEIKEFVIQNSDLLKYPEEEKIFPYTSNEEEIANPEALNNYRIARMPAGAIKLVGTIEPEGYDPDNKIDVKSYKSRRWVMNENGKMELKSVLVSGYQRASKNRKILKEKV